MHSFYDKTVTCLRQLCLLSCVAFFFSTASHARPPTEMEFLAAQLLGEEIGAWVDRLPNRPQSLGVFSVRTSAPLDLDYSSVMEAEILKSLRSYNNVTVVSCPECRAPQLKVVGDRVIITKGTPDIETFKEMGKKNAVESFIVVDVYRTSLSVIAQATIYHSGSGEVLASDRFKIPALEFANAQLVLQAGPGFMLNSQSDKEDSFPLAADLIFFEEMSFGKAGLNIGGIFAPGETVGYIMPVLAWRKRFGSSAVTGLTTVGAGFGLSSKRSGLELKLSYDIFLGTFTLIGVQANAFFPLASKDPTIAPDGTLSSNKEFGGFIGIHLGLSLGR